MLELRKSGIDILGDIPGGSHFCNFYETKQDLLDTLVPYFKAGLESKEFCLWVVPPSELITVEEAKVALKKAVPDLDRHLSDKNIEIHNEPEWYLGENVFNLEKVTTNWDAKLKRALALGYNGMRVSGDTFWLSGKDWKDFCAYEKQLNDAITGLPMIVLCTYPLGRSGAADVLDVVQTHQFTIARRKGKWEAMETASQTLHKLDQANAELRKEIARHKESEIRLIGEKELSGKIIDSIPGIFELYNKNFGYLRWNKQFEIFTGYSSDDILNLHAAEDLFLGEDLKKKYSIVKRIFETGRYEGEITFTTKGGKKTPVYFVGQRISYEGESCIICIALDITERKRIEEELKFEQRDKEALINSADDMIWSVSRDFKLIVANKAFVLRIEGLTGIIYKPGDDLMKPEVYPEDILTFWKEAYNRALSGETFKKEIYTPAVNEFAETWTEVSFNPIYKDDIVVALACYSRDITERKKAGEMLKQSYEEIRRLTEHLQKIREEERIHIAREIHDELGQQLTALTIEAKGLNKKLNDADEGIKQEMGDIIDLLDTMVKSVRRISSELRPSLLYNLGLVAAIEWHLKEFEKRTGIKTIFNEPKDELELPDSIKKGLFRIFQESLTNVSRHANANKVNVILEQKDQELFLSIEDNGQGFEKENIAAKDTLGILGMKERSQMMGGNYEITSIPGKGTMVIVVIPFNGKNNLI